MAYQDTPDWGGQYVSAVFQPLGDLAELAVRLGSIVRDDRRGAVIWLEDFSRGLNGVTLAVGHASSSYALDNNPVDTGFWSVRMTTGTNIAGLVNLLKSLPVPLEDRIGLMCRFLQSTSTYKLSFQIAHYTGALLRLYNVIINSTDDDIVIQTDSGNQTVIENVGSLDAIGGWSAFKLVADITLIRSS
jgi:hypothetical protein